MTIGEVIEMLKLIIEQIIAIFSDLFASEEDTEGEANPEA